jgi:hypothetical protein
MCTSIHLMFDILSPLHTFFYPSYQEHFEDTKLPSLCYSRLNICEKEYDIVIIRRALCNHATFVVGVVTKFNADIGIYVTRRSITNLESPLKQFLLSCLNVYL